MAAQPLVLPEPFSGESSWEQWNYHFENDAAVNDWADTVAESTTDTVAESTTHGIAQTAFQRFPVATRANVKLATKALQEQFEPSSRKTRYQVELQTRRKRKTESWVDLAEDLRMMADKAHPDMEENDRERLALNAYLAQLENPHIAFGVKQKNPATLDAAVTSTLELESYWNPKLSVATLTKTSEPGSDSCGVSAVSQKPVGMTNDNIASLFEKLLPELKNVRLFTLTHQLGHYIGREGEKFQDGLHRPHMLDLWEEWSHLQAVPLSANRKTRDPLCAKPSAEG